MQKMIWLVVISFICIVQSTSANDMKKLTAFQLKAGATALEDFMGTEQNMANLQYYYTLISENEEFYEVNFEKGSSLLLTFTVGCS